MAAASNGCAARGTVPAAESGGGAGDGDLIAVECTCGDAGLLKTLVQLKTLDMHKIRVWPSLELLI